MSGEELDLNALAAQARANATGEEEKTEPSGELPKEPRMTGEAFAALSREDQLARAKAAGYEEEGLEQYIKDTFVSSINLDAVRRLVAEADEKPADDSKGDFSSF